ncbi:MAG: hypothetical protein ACOVRM_07550 [Planctomycetaceae bacterium]|jgi:hypothetical protein
MTMRLTRVTLGFLLLITVCSAQAVADGPRGCAPWRPCGPGNSFGGNRLIPQAGFGADFRPSCSSHDACLAAGVPRRDCDRQFLHNMQCACEQSRHPILCRLQARWYYTAARVFGGLYY